MTCDESGYIIEIINHFYGIDFADYKNKLSSIKLNRLLHEKSVDLNKVIYSMWNDKDNGMIWIIAANKYYSENETQELIEFIIRHNIYNEYILDK